MTAIGKDKLIDMIKTGASMTLKQQIKLTIALSTPAILAQLSMIIMQYIDASMVGSLGANDSASIGLVSTSMWLFGGLLSAAAMGFTVQVAHLIGANRNDDARSVLRQSLLCCLLFSIALLLVVPSVGNFHTGLAATKRYATMHQFIFSFCHYFFLSLK